MYAGSFWSYVYVYCSTCLHTTEGVLYQTNQTRKLLFDTKQKLQKMSSHINILSNMVEGFGSILWKGGVIASGLVAVGLGKCSWPCYEYSVGLIDVKLNTNIAR